MAWQIFELSELFPNCSVVEELSRFSAKVDGNGGVFAQLLQSQQPLWQRMKNIHTEI
jgi:hypothetical protein